MKFSGLLVLAATAILLAGCLDFLNGSNSTVTATPAVNATVDANATSDVGTPTPILLPNPDINTSITITPTPTPTGEPSATPSGAQSCQLTASSATGTGSTTIDFTATYANLPSDVTVGVMTCQAGGASLSNTITNGVTTRSCSYANPNATTVFTGTASAGFASCTASVTIYRNTTATPTPTPTPTATPVPGTSMSLSSPAATPANTTAVFTWTSNLGGNSYAYYGTTTGMGSTANNSASESVTTHSVNVSGLSVNTPYYYVVQSCTNSSATAFCANSTQASFTTQSNSQATLTLNAGSTDLAVTYGTSVTYVAGADFGTANLSKNGTSVTLSSGSFTETPAAGTFALDAQTPGDSTHAWSHQARTLTVNAASTTPTLTLNGTAADMTNAGATTVIAAASCSTGGTVVLYKNGTSQGLSGGTYTETVSTPTSYNFTTYCTPDANHTSSALTYWMYAT